jgi:hypothetical protein
LQFIHLIPIISSKNERKKGEGVGGRRREEEEETFDM